MSQNKDEKGFGLVRSFLEKSKEKIRLILDDLGDRKLTVLFVGGTGSGKSSTINALFDTNRARVGVGATPQTQDTTEYKLGNFTIYDSPGLGDSEENDRRHMQNISNLLMLKDEKDKGIVDLAVVIVNASSRDLEGTYKVIKDVLVNHVDNNRILVALNQCDRAMNEPGMFDYDRNEPSEDLIQYLDEFADDIRKRIKADTGVNMDVIYYSAGAFNSRTKSKYSAYNLSKLLKYIVEILQKKRGLCIEKHEKMVRTLSPPIFKIA